MNQIISDRLPGHRKAIEAHIERMRFAPEDMAKIGKATRHARNLVDWGYQALGAFYERYFRLPSGTEDLEIDAEDCPEHLAGHLCAILYIFELARTELNTLADERNVDLYELLAEAKATLHYLGIIDGIDSERKENRA